jgi:Galactose-3-O-sulfotransferase
MSRPVEGSVQEPHGSVSINVENALHALDKESGLLDGAVRALVAIDVVGICEAHSASLRLISKALAWDAEVEEFELNQAKGQKTLKDLSRSEIDTLSSLNLIDAQLYGHAIGKFLRACRRYGIELNEDEGSALSRRGSRIAELRFSRAQGSTRFRLFGRLREFAMGIARLT